LNGVDKNYDPNATWSALGATSVDMSAAGIVVVPEASTLWSLGLVLLASLCNERRRRMIGR
jgi:hypothetical protein